MNSFGIYKKSNFLMKIKFFEFIAYSVFGLALWLSLGSHTLKIWEHSIRQSLLTLPILFLSGFAISLLTIQKVLIPHLKESNIKTWIVWILASSMFALFLLFVIPIRSLDIPVKHTLKIIATGQKNDLSKGTEVWLHSIISGDEVFSSHLKNICKGDWEVNNANLVSSNNQPSVLICTIRTTHNLSARFIISPLSGKVELISGSRVEKIDLYSNYTDVKKYNIVTNPSLKRAVIRYSIWLADWLWLSLFLFSLSAWLIYRTAPQLTASEQRLMNWFFYSIPTVLVWSIYLLAFWPGSMTSDSLLQWHQILSGKYTDSHPAFHTLSIWLITRLWSSPASVALVQILVLSMVIGWGVLLIRKWGAPKSLAWSVIGLMAISPANGMMVVTLWKDIPYSVSIVALSLFVLLMVKSSGEWIQNHAAWIVLGVVSALVALYRHNGTIAAFGTLSCLLLVYRNHWKRVFITLLFAVGLWWLVRGPIYHIVGVKKSQGNLYIGVASVYVIDRHLNTGAILQTKEQDLVSHVLPINPGWPYNCYNLSELRWKVNSSFIAAHSLELLRLAINLTLRNPIQTINHMICHNAFIFQITQPPRSSYQYAPGGIYKNTLGLKTDSKLPSFQNFILNEIPKTGEPEWNWLIWRTAFWMYLLFFASIIACFRTRSWNYLLIPLPVSLNSLSLIFTAGIQSFRYVYPTMLVSILLSGYLMLIQSRSR
jgi:hypothetical protein